MLACTPPIVEVDVTAIPVPTADEANVPLKVRVTVSGEITPFKVPVRVAVLVPSNNLLLAAAPKMVNAFDVISAVKLDGKVTVYFAASVPPKV